MDGGLVRKDISIGIPPNRAFWCKMVSVLQLCLVGENCVNVLEDIVTQMENGFKYLVRTSITLFVKRLRRSVSILDFNIALVYSYCTNYQKVVS